MLGRVNIVGHVSFTMLQRVTLQNKFYNMLAYAAVKVPRGVLCVV